MKNFLKAVGSNCRIFVRTLAVDFKISLDFLVKTNVETENAEIKNELSRKLWTQGDLNP